METSDSPARMGRPPKRRRGRPVKTEAQKRKNGVMVRYTDDELDKLEALAAEAGEPIATYVWRNTPGVR